MIDLNDMLSTALQEAFNMESDESFPTIDEGKIINNYINYTNSY